FEKHYTQLLDEVTKMDESTWHTNGQFKVQGQLRMEMPIGQFLWLFHNDAIHHRGQLAAYIRPMGGKVPSIYGPSGDDPGNCPTFAALRLWWASPRTLPSPLRGYGGQACRTRRTRRTQFLVSVLFP